MAPRARLNGFHCWALLKTGLGQSFVKLATGWCRVAVVVQEQHQWTGPLCECVRPVTLQMLSLLSKHFLRALDEL